MSRRKPRPLFAIMGDIGSSLACTLLGFAGAACLFTGFVASGAPLLLRMGLVALGVVAVAVATAEAGR